MPRDKDLSEHPENLIAAQPYAMGLVVAVIKEILPARVIIDNMVHEAARIIKASNAKINPMAKL